MEMIRNALNPAALEMRRLLDKKAGPQEPVMEIIQPSFDGNRQQRRAAEALHRKKQKKVSAPA